MFLRLQFLSIPCVALCQQHCGHNNVYNLELAVLALARIMCADIHSQNGIAILAHVVLLLRFESKKLCSSSIVCDSHVLQTLHMIFTARGIASVYNLVCLDLMG